MVRSIAGDKHASEYEVLYMEFWFKLTESCLSNAHGFQGHRSVRISDLLQVFLQLYLLHTQ